MSPMQVLNFHQNVFYKNDSMDVMEENKKNKNHHIGFDRALKFQPTNSLV